MYSIASQQTVETLEGLEKQIMQMRIQCDDAQKHLDSPPENGIPPGLRNDLAQLHGNANQLLATRLDAILTGELNSGKMIARQKRKELIGQAEKIIENVERQIQRIDATKAERAR